MNDLLNKKIVVLGFGKEGKSTYNYLRSIDSNMSIDIMDQKYQNIKVDDPNVKVIDTNYDDLKDYDLIFKTPGISFKDVDITPFEDKLTSQAEYFLSHTKAKTIGITGTKGKSTTSSLIYEVLKAQGKDAFLIGNIGNPIFDDMNELNENSYAVIELSSHQLEYVKHSPNVSLILNLHPEHLDHYKSLEDYYLAKLNIALYQNEDDDYIYLNDYGALKDLTEKLPIKSHKHEINNENIVDNRIIFDSKEVFDGNISMPLKGKHNLMNIAFVLEVCNVLGLDIDKASETIRNFKGLAHRMEFIDTFNGVTYYNDSIATIPESSINAIEALKNVNTLIVGGMDRGISYEEYIEYLKSSDIENIICIPDTGNYIYEKLKEYKNVYKAEDVKKAAQIASKVTKEGTICLLSPAATSYNMYKNFEERGNAFKEALYEIKDQENNARTSRS